MRRSLAGLLVLLAVVQEFKGTFSLPVSVLDNNVSNSLEDEDEDDEDSPILEEDFTTHGLERLSSAATCLVAGVEYTHGQQIYRNDPCEFCLCLDGEMFCWWQDCPPTMEGPCRDRGPFSPCISVPANPQLTVKKHKSTAKNSSGAVTTQTSSTPLSSTTDESAMTDNPTEESSSTIEIDVGTSSEVEEFSTSKEPKECIVMGKEYQIGDKLPHDTGNCLECICGPGAKVTCSPNQCAPVDDEINDYRSPGRQQTQDLF